MKHLDTGNLIRSIGLGLLAMLGATLATQADTAAKHVVYVGAQQPDTDTSYKQFAQALSRATARRPTPLRLEYLHVPISEHAEKKLALAQAFRNKPNVLIAPTAATALAAVQVPHPDSTVLFVSAPDPVRVGIVPSMRSPGPGVTGVSMADDWHHKRLELLRDAFPKPQRLGVLLDREWVKSEDFDVQVAQPAKSLGFDATAFFADTAAQASQVLQSAQARRMQAWYIPRNYIAHVAHKEIIQALSELKVPAMHATEQAVAQGGLMAFAQDVPAASDLLADLTVRVLRGEAAGKIPVQRLKKFVLAVRPREEPGTPQMQPAIIRRADRVY
jgi:putative tryptophan/tyrosine transport system substrate-binding protein